MKTELSIKIYQSDDKLFGHHDRIQSVDWEMTERFNDLNCKAILGEVIRKLKDEGVLKDE